VGSPSKPIPHKIDNFIEGNAMHILRNVGQKSWIYEGVGIDRNSVPSRFTVLESVDGAAREGADPEEADLNKLPNPSSSLLSSSGDVVPVEPDLPK
jgi:hypothetical protein